MLDWLRRLIVGDYKPTATAYDRREQEVVERLATIRKQSPEQVRAEARRRALAVELESMRHR